MPNFELLFSAQLTHVKEIQPPSADTDWFLKIKCTQCSEIHPKFISINANEKIPHKGDRSHVNMYLKCKLCSREITANIVENSIKPYGEDDSGKFRPIIKISFNSCEPVEFSLRDGWKVTSSSENETVFSDADFSSGEWTDYDENAGVCLEVMEIKTQFKLSK